MVNHELVDQLRKLESRIWQYGSNRWKADLDRMIRCTAEKNRKAGNPDGWAHIWSNLDEFFLLASQALEEG